MLVIGLQLHNFRKSVFMKEFICKYMYNIAIGCFLKCASITDVDVDELMDFVWNIFS